MVSSEAELRDLKQTFEMLDVNGDGVLSFKEIHQGMTKVGINDEKEVEEIFKGMDLDMNGQVEQTEFLAAMMDHRKQEMDDEKIIMAFKHLDFDESGFIERSEIIKLLGVDNESVVDYILSLVDINNDGKISFSEFKELMIQESFGK